MYESVVLKLSMSNGCQKDVKWGILKRLHIEDTTPVQKRKEFMQICYFRLISQVSSHFFRFCSSSEKLPAVFGVLGPKRAAISPSIILQTGKLRENRLQSKILDISLKNR